MAYASTSVVKKDQIYHINKLDGRKELLFWNQNKICILRHENRKELIGGESSNGKSRTHINVCTSPTRQQRKPLLLRTKLFQTHAIGVIILLLIVASKTVPDRMERPRTKYDHLVWDEGISVRILWWCTRTQYRLENIIIETWTYQCDEEAGHDLKTG